MSNVKIGAVIYAPKVTVIWGIIADFFKEEGFPVEPVFYKDYVSQIDGLMNGKLILRGILHWHGLMPISELKEKLLMDQCVILTGIDRLIL